MDNNSVTENKRKELGERIGKVAELYKNYKDAAKIAGISPSQLSRYIKESGNVSLEPVALLCEQKNVSINWVWTGAGNMYISAHNHLPNNSDSVNESRQPYTASEKDPLLVLEDINKEIMKASKRYNFSPHIYWSAILFELCIVHNMSMSGIDRIIKALAAIENDPNSLP